MRIADYISYQLLVSSAEPSFEDFYHIYAESIDPREQKSKAAISKMAGRPDYKILLQKKGELIVGFSIVFAPRGEAFCLLEYMAVDRPYRSLGFGSKLFLQTAESSKSTGGELLPVLLEVDSDREPTADQEVRSRRLKFYKRLGCLAIDGLSYILPLPGIGSPPEMDLLLYLPPGFSHLRRPQLENWLKIVYRDVYNCLPDDPRISKMLKNVADPVAFR